MKEFTCEVCRENYYSASNDPDFIKCPFCGGDKDIAEDPLLKSFQAGFDRIFNAPEEDI